MTFMTFPRMPMMRPDRLLVPLVSTPAKTFNRPLTELAVRTMLAREGVTCVLTGVETLAQLRGNLALFNQGPLPADLLAAVDAAVPELPEAWITPSMWPSLKS